VQWLVQFVFLKTTCRYLSFSVQIWVITFVLLETAAIMTITIEIITSREWSCLVFFSAEHVLLNLTASVRLGEKRMAAEVPQRVGY